MTFKKKKNKEEEGCAYCVEWDFDASGDSNDNDDDKKSIKKKALAIITINNKPSIFDTSSSRLINV
jgi:hypothetical protein